MTTTETAINGATQQGEGSPLRLAERIDQALDHVVSEQQRTARLLARGAKCRQLSALYEREARLWTLLAQHTAQRVYWRAVTEARHAARDRAREYAQLARRYDEHDQRPAAGAGGSSP